MIRRQLTYILSIACYGWAALVPCRADSAPSVLPNGLRVAVRERRTTPLVAIDLWVRAGAYEEGLNENGSAHFLEHTLFKGTTTHEVGWADYAIENLGGLLNAATGPDYAHFYTEVPAAHLTEALTILADIVRNATLPDAEVDRERNVILDELARRDADPTSELVDALYAHAFPDRPYGLSPGGQPAAIRSRGRDTLVAFYRRTYQPQRCTLALVGDLSADQGQRAATKAFGDWQAPATAAENEKPASIPALNANVSALAPRSTAQAAIGIAFPAPAAGQGDMVAAALVTAALLGGRQSGGRFDADLWTGTDITVRYTPRMETCLFLITANKPAPIPTRPFEPHPAPAFADVSALETAIEGQVAALSTAPPSKAELEEALHVALGHLQYDTETNAGLAHEIGYDDLVSGDSPEALRARLAQLTPADIQNFASRWLDPRKRIVVRRRPAL